METLLLLGFALGLRHSTDADHVAAVSVLVADPERRGSLLSRARTGALWGAGHLLAVLMAGGALILWRVNLPPAAAAALELAVAFVLIWLGVRAIRQVTRGRLHFHAHRHGGLPHAHVHVHSETAPEHEHSHDSHLPVTGDRSLGAFALGTLHGLAGTAGLTLLVLATIPSRAAALLYLLTFGAGALLGMTLFSAGLSLLLRGTSRWLTLARLAAGAANAAIGVVLAHRTLLSL